MPSGTFRVFVVVTAVVAIALGIVAIVWPRPSLVVVALLFGVYLVVAGALRVFAAVRGHGTPPGVAVDVRHRRRASSRSRGS